MYIKSIQIENFRNYGRLDLIVEPSINILYGENAQGKTNIIEAIYLCTCARSHRTSKDKEMILHGQKQYKVSIVLSSQRMTNHTAYDETLSITYSEASEMPSEIIKAKRLIEYNEVPLARLSDLMGIFHAVVFAPEDLLLIKDGPSVRRRYMDLLISQVRPCYFHDLVTYTKILHQRNRTLKLLRQKKSLHLLDLSENSEIEIWDFPLTEVASRIIIERILFSRRISTIASQKHEQISGGKEKLFVKYRTVPGLLSEDILHKPEENMENIGLILLERFKNTHQEDYERGTTGSGPHRDDLELSLDGDGLRAFASQGQQRSAALALKLAELQIIKEETGEMPVLLLDDVFSELDSRRRSCLLSNIENAQVFITCTDRSFILHEMKDSLKEIIVKKKSSCDISSEQSMQSKVTELTFFEVIDGSVQKR